MTPPDPRRSDARCVPAGSFVATVEANVDNPAMTDADFRAFIRSTLPIVVYPRPLTRAPSQPPIFS